jgi:hypothetical protein
VTRTAQTTRVPSLERTGTVTPVPAAQEARSGKLGGLRVVGAAVWKGADSVALVREDEEHTRIRTLCSERTSHEGKSVSLVSFLSLLSRSRQRSNLDIAAATCSCRAFSGSTELVRLLPTDVAPLVTHKTKRKRTNSFSQPQFTASLRSSTRPCPECRAQGPKGEKCRRDASSAASTSTFRRV